MTPKHIPGFHPPPKEVSNSLGGSSSAVSIADMIAAINSPTSALASSPFENHAIVFSAAFICSLTGSQAPLKIYAEKKTNSTSSRKKYGKRRQRYQQNFAGISPERRLQLQSNKLLSVDDHPVALSLYKPNPYLTGPQLVQLLILWLQLRGEVFVIRTNESGGPVSRSGQQYLWPISGDLVSEVLEYGDYGPVVGWEVKLPEYLSHGYSDAAVFGLDQVIQVKFPDPTYPIRGVSRLRAIARNVETDISVDKLNAGLATRGGQPKGVLETAEALTSDQRDEIRTKFNTRYGPADQAGKIPVLSGGLQYKAISLSPQEMQFLEQRKLSRQEICAALGVPESVLGFSEAQTYATQLGQDRNLWDKTLLPILRLIEESFDTELLYTESDDVFIAFDLTGVEALRVGLVEKIQSAKIACESSLHMPPKVAYTLYGLEVEEYAGNDEAFVAPTLTTVDRVLSGELLSKKDSGDSEPSGDANESENPATPKEGADDKKDEGLEDQPLASVEENAIKVSELLTLHQQLEKSLLSRYSIWLREEEEILIAELESYSNAVKPTDVIRSVKSMAARLRSVFGGWYSSVYTKILNLTQKEFDNTNEFNPLDPILESYQKSSVSAFVDTYSNVIHKKLLDEVSEGLKAGESIEQVTDRVSAVFSVLKSKSNMIPSIRFQVTSFMNGLRFYVYSLLGVNKKWSTAGDEKVRPAHATLGGLGTRPLDHNYLIDLGRESEGVLAFPGDLRAPKNLTFGCRCFITKS